MGEYRLKVNGNDFGNNLIDAVAKRYDPIVVEGSGHIRFGNEGNEGRVKSVIHVAIHPGFFHHMKKILSK